MIEYGKYHILEGIYPHICLHIGLLADGNIHNRKLIYRYIFNNDHPVKTLLIALTLRVILYITLTFNCRGVLSFAHINEVMWIQNQQFFEIRLLV